MKTAIVTNGLVCPFPVEEAEAAIAKLDPGDELTIGFDCTQGTKSIPIWAAKHGYTVTNFVRDGDASWQITVRK